MTLDLQNVPSPSVEIQHHSAPPRNPDPYELKCEKFYNTGTSTNFSKLRDEIMSDPQRCVSNFEAVKFRIVCCVKVPGFPLETDLENILESNIDTGTLQ
jgi:hypothetical protein